MKTQHLIILFSALAIASCNQAPKPENKPIPTAEMTASKEGINIAVDQLAMPTDTICGMSLADGIADTLQVGDKIYGFCSTGCKESFAEQLAQK